MSLSTFRTPLPFAFCLLAALFLGLTSAKAQGPEPSKQPASSPAGTKAAAELADAAKTRIKKVGPTDYTLGDMTFSSATHEIRIPAVVNMSEGILEYALVHENGKTHESLLKTPVKPTELNVALLLCNYEPHIKEAAQFLEDPLRMPVHACLGLLRPPEFRAPAG